MKLKISVIIPSRNRQHFVKNAIADLINQTIELYEIIIVDQSELPYQLDNCVHIHLSSRGPCVSRNEGIKHAKGDVLVFLDDDIRAEEDFIEKLTEPIFKGETKVVAGAMCNEKGEYPNQTASDYLERRSVNWMKIITANPDYPGSKFTLSLPGCCFAISKEVLQEVGGFDEFFDPSGAGEDRELGIRLFKNGHNILYKGDAKLFHIGAPTGGSRDIDSRALMLDINLGYIVYKHFSRDLFESYKDVLIHEYRQKFLRAIFQLKLVRDRYSYYRRIKKEITSIPSRA